MNRTLAIVLAADGADRLHPLTRGRPAAAVPFGGKYRLIDFVLSNCVNSGGRRVLVLGQYRYHSLMKHLRDGWGVFNPELGEFITLVPPQMRRGEEWYQGVVDALYQNLDLLERNSDEHILILPGNQLYRMDYAALQHYHDSLDADITVVCSPGDAPAQTPGVEADDVWRIRAVDSDGAALRAMGIYLIRKSVLLEFLHGLRGKPRVEVDLLRHLARDLMQQGRAHAYVFGGDAGRVSQDGYWRPIDSLDAYYEASMALLDARTGMDLYQREWPIRGLLRQFPPALVRDAEEGKLAQVHGSLLANGVWIDGATVRHSVIGPGVRIEPGAHVENAVLLDDVRVGAGALVRNAVLDKEVRVHSGEAIGPGEAPRDGRSAVISPAGIVVVARANGR